MIKRRAAICGGAFVAAAAASWALKPRQRASDVLSAVNLEKQVPAQFEGWKIDEQIVPVLPNPEVQAKLDAIYTQVLARTYVHTSGERVMLSIAYGADQGSDATAVHRPEFCYSAQGFVVKGYDEHKLVLGQRDLLTRRLIAKLGARSEPIMYWVTLNDSATLPGAERKIAQIRLGLLGLIPDGMLVRVSSISANPANAFGIQERFLAQLSTAMDASVVDRYFGRI